MNRRFLLGLLQDWGIAFGVVLAIFVAVNWLTSPTPPPLGEAPAFELSDLEGASHTLDSLDDDVVILNFWFTTCGPCRHEIPELAAYHDENPDVNLVGISVDRGMPRARLAAVSNKLGINYPVLHDVDTQVAQAYGVRVFPTTLLVHEGKVVASRVGEVDRRSLARLVDEARVRSGE